MNAELKRWKGVGQEADGSLLKKPEGCFADKLIGLSAQQRTLRYADGPDEVHKGMVSRLELKKYQ